ncbi:NUDIX domain-containing protein [Myceligenerans sp. I2]|uniref:NUDIX domain-containing protein n=2 Tax=Myceligenerans indicum TaxID=2593663 RepID=A0ABS1LNR6_9MICO|nr:NUDIX domain-containing protein [Myceligenerans indicum]
MRGGSLQVQLVHRPKYDDWSWPKGRLDNGETSQAGAIREVAEETGKPIVLGRPLPGLQYLTPEGRVKHVRYWAARRARKGHDSFALAARSPVAPVNRREIDRAEWLGVDDAADRLTREADRRPLEALAEAYEAGLLGTRTVVIARHGRAYPRSEWHGSERDRPLTPVGHAHAAALVPVLAAYGVEQAVSSRWERCATTIDPYVRAAGLRPSFSEYLTEAQHERSPSRVAATMRDLLAETNESSVLCTHRPVMPTVLDALAQHAPHDVADVLPSRDPFLDPGELLVAHVAPTGTQNGGEPQVVAVEHVAPPLH